MEELRNEIELNIQLGAESKLRKADLDELLYSKARDMSDTGQSDEDSPVTQSNLLTLTNCNILIMSILLHQ